MKKVTESVFPTPPLRRKEEAAELKKLNFTLIIGCLGLIIQITCVITTFQNFYVLRSASLRSVSAPIHQKKKQPKNPQNNNTEY